MNIDKNTYNEGNNTTPVMQPNMGNQTQQNGYQQSGYQQSGYQQSGYQQTGYQQNMNQNMQNNFNQTNAQYQKPVATYNNDLDKVGAFGMNLMIYILIASAFFMGGLTEALIIVFAVAFLAEKDTKLIKVLATLVIMEAGIFIVYSFMYNLLTPFSALGSTIMRHASYDSIIYNLGSFISTGLSTFRQILIWVYNTGLMLVGLIQFNNIRKGKFKIPKIIDKYFN